MPRVDTRAVIQEPSRFREARRTICPAPLRNALGCAATQLGASPHAAQLESFRELDPSCALLSWTQRAGSSGWPLGPSNSSLHAGSPQSVGMLRTTVVDAPRRCPTT